MKPWMWMAIGAVGGCLFSFLGLHFLGMWGVIGTGGSLVVAVAGAHVRELKRSRDNRKKILDRVEDYVVGENEKHAEKASQARRLLDDIARGKR